jgi:soluble lytic murein transglycosylase-like protein
MEQARQGEGAAVRRQPLLTEWHRVYAGSVRWRLTRDGIEVEGSGIERTRGEPETVTRIWERYGRIINAEAVNYTVPCALIVATIATESGGAQGAVRREPGFESHETTPHRVSVGLMQTLISTARVAVGSSLVDYDWLLKPENAIRAGTAYIDRQRMATRLDPPLVACAYNAGGVYRNDGAYNRWKMRQYPVGTGEHCDRFVRWFNDAVAVLGKHRNASSVPYAWYL